LHRTRRAGVRGIGGRSQGGGGQGGCRKAGEPGWFLLGCTGPGRGAFSGEGRLGEGTRASGGESGYSGPPVGNPPARGGAKPRGTPDGRGDNRTAPRVSWGGKEMLKG